MGVFKRVGDIVTANLNEMVEQFEDPEKMLKQAVREMDQSINDARQQVARAMASEKLVKKELDANRAEVNQWHDRAALAVAAGDDALARKALARKQEHEKLVAALEDQYATAHESVQTLRRQLEGMQAKAAEAKRRLGTLTARKRAADVRSRMAGAPTTAELKSDAFAKFDRLREKVELAEAEADAMCELSESPAVASIDEFDAESSATDTEIETELAALKKQKTAKSKR